jgi:putative ATP-dependent endonuclease of the OLD family
MKLSAVYIKNVRSVKDAGIEDIDNFNVLIGKANSGKSNILSGIHAFFQILSNGYLVSSNPMIGNLSEFTQRDATHPISISAQFTPSHDEIISILKQMRDERPEISTALEALPPDLSLYIRMSILSPPKAYSFIEEVALTSLSDKTRTWSLLQIGLPSAEELHGNYRDYQATQRDHESLTRLLTRVDADDWRRLRRDEPPYLYRAVLDSAGVSPDTITTLRPIVAASESFVGFQTAIRKKIGKLEDARRVISERRLTAPVKTFRRRSDSSIH